MSMSSSSEEIMTANLPHLELPSQSFENANKAAICMKKLMLLFPLVHPAAVHGLLVTFDYNEDHVFSLLSKTHTERAQQYLKTSQESGTSDTLQKTGTSSTSKTEELNKTQYNKKTRKVNQKKIGKTKSKK